MEQAEQKIPNKPRPSYFLLIVVLVVVIVVPLVLLILISQMLSLSSN